MNATEKAKSQMAEALANFFDQRLAAARNPECTSSATKAKEATSKLAAMLVENPPAAKRLAETIVQQ